MSWADRYRPSDFANTIIKPDSLKKIVSWLNQWRLGKPAKNVLLLHGPPGTGKTTMAHVLSKEMGLKIVEMNSSERRNGENLRMIGKMAGLYRDLTDFTPEVSGPDKIVLIDEADNLFEGRVEGSDTGGMKALAEIAGTTQNPVIVTMNDYYEFKRKNYAKDIIENSVEIEMVPYTRRNERDFRDFRERLKQRMKSIAEAEGLSVTGQIIDQIIERNGTDIRAAMNDLESMMGSDGSMSGIRDSRESIYKTVEEILFRGNMEKGIFMSRDGDFTPEDLLMWLDENTGQVALSEEDKATAYDLLSKCDIFIGRIRKKQHYAFKGYSQEVSCGVRHVMRAPNTHYVKFQFPRHIRNLSRIRSGGYARRGVEAKISRYIHASPVKTRETMWFFSTMRKHRPDLFREVSTRLNLQESELDQF
ncbi:MAG: replication factor C large subunit [Candidatus Thermoplasmatota archaeon]|nr:replication factor C large subunit [Candidatus Thermoplasmatota archaeon]MCL5437829.1 replication factor C large subunit [Candidatus Thermoplasmatota archaeon]